MDTQRRKRQRRSEEVIDENKTNYLVKITNASFGLKIETSNSYEFLNALDVDKWFPQQFILTFVHYFILHFTLLPLLYHRARRARPMGWMAVSTCLLAF